MDERLSQSSCIVFDVGNVLLTFEPDRVMELIPEEYREYLREAMFGPEGRWGAFDLGAQSNVEIAQDISGAAGILEGEGMVLHALYTFPETMRPMPLYHLIPELKKMGKKLYALTNYCEPPFSRTVDRFENLKLLDGMVVSNREKVVKPDPAIFGLLIERYGVAPEQSLFIDDSLPNVLTAKSLGFNTWHYAGGDVLPG